jgi:iron complex transport system ATP-binding protein
VGSESSLELRDVRAAYGSNEVLHGIDVSASAGEVVGLVGPNGCGKTTLVRVASRTLRPTSGDVRVGARDPYAMSGREAARVVAVVPQDVLPAFDISVLEFVMMGRSPFLSRWGSGSERDWEAVREAMEAVAVQHLADRSMVELSGGERRRVVLAQALAQEAPVLLLDEPTTHLDIRHVIELHQLMRQLAATRGTAVLAVLHDLTLAAAACDRLVAMSEGSIVAEGRPDEVVTVELLRDVYRVAADVVTSPATGRPTVSVGPPETAVATISVHALVVGGAGRGAPLFRLLMERGVHVSAGVLHGTDTDEEVAERLDLDRVSVPPFSGIGDDTASAWRRLAERSDVIVVCDAPVGPGNVRNLELALEAARGGRPVVILDATPIAERDFTGGRATQIWTELVDRAESVTTYEAAVAAVLAVSADG